MNDVFGNKVIFYINENDIVFSCDYFENIEEKKHASIILPTDNLNQLLWKFLKKYENNLEEKIQGPNTVLTFFDVDVYEMDKIIKISQQYQEDFIREIREKEQEELKKQLKVERRNRFRKTAITVSATLFATLALYASVKEIPKVMAEAEFVRPTEVVYHENDFFKFREQQNIFPMEETNTNDNDLNNSEITENKNDNTDYSDVPIGTVIGEPVVIEAKPVQNEEIVETQESYEEAEIIPDAVFSLNADDWIDTDKYFQANAYYSDAITRAAKTYGIDPQLALAIACHERGLHSVHVDPGGGIGLFQIQVEGAWNWENKKITAYNFDTNSYETVIITKDSVSDVFQNIKVGCMMIQNMLIRNNYNVVKAVMEYNYGASYVETVINRCSNETGYSINELNSMDNLEWLNYRNIISGGDSQYVENVFKFIPDGAILSFTKPSGETINLQYNNSNSHKFTF